MSDTNSREELWKSLCQKYEKRGKLNTSECSVSKINYKHFAKPALFGSRLKRKRNKRNNVFSNSSNSYDTKEKTESSSLDIESYNMDDDVSASILDSKKLKGVNNGVLSTSNVINIVRNETHQRVSPPHQRHSSEVNLEGVDFSENQVHHSTSAKQNENIDKFSSVSSKSNQENYFQLKLKPVALSTHPREIKQVSENTRHSIDKNFKFVELYSLEDLIRFVEVNLSSTLRDMLLNRSECKILETDEYSHWHECTKKEMKRLRKYISSKQLKEYMRYCNENINVSLLHERISSSVRNKLRDLLIKREVSKNHREMYARYYNKIQIEWRRFIKDVPVEYLVFYALYVVKCIKDKQLSVSNHGQDSNIYALEFHSKTT